ncbi:MULTISPECIES: hypothetical protein [Agrobacterium]|uniref:hypothetical protein n=1 Tax=Agrobacterium TaxID=357 RepID=UPI0009BBB892|nr:MULTISPECIES: hypothetical protein [Agrobacterium]QCL72131.1 hypothetical protein CFBP5499_00870 [Agrobacterium tumefaciens]CUX23908.1 conserved exported hypothetical protein [Agrobacterium sp. NCPPB 925]
MSIRKSWLSAAFLLASAGASFANGWFTKSEEDVFSGKQTAVMLGSAVSGSVYITCDAERNVSVSFIFPMKEDIDTSLKGVIVLKVDSGEAVRLDGEAYQHNEKYGGFKADVQDDQKATIVKSIGGAKKKILAGLHVESLDSKHSVDISPDGSTKAAGQFLKACELQ